VKLALANNERALKAPLRVEAAEGQLERARAAFLPTLTAGGTGTLAAQPDRNGRILAGTGQVAVNQPIISLPAFPLYAQARHQLESERWGAVEDKRVLAFDAAKAYLVTVAGERLVGTAQRRLDRAHAAEQDATSRAEAGLTSVNDVTRSKIDTSTAENQLAQAKGSLDRAYLQLAFLVARPVAGPLTPPQQTSAAAQRGQWRMDDVLRAAEARRGFAGGIWNTLAARGSVALDPSNHLFAEGSIVMKGVALAENVGGPPFVVTLGAQHTF